MPTLREAIYQEVQTLPGDALRELLAMAIRMLAARGAATEEQLSILRQLEGADMSVQLSFIAGQQSGISPFEAIRHEDDHGEYWLARELQQPLGYIKWQMFQVVVERAKIACRNSGQDTRNHFTGASKMVELGSAAQREVFDLRLSRYACYLVAMNGDPRKREISEAQTYFAIQTRRQEINDIRQADAITSNDPDILALEHILSFMRRKDAEDARRDRDIAEIKETLRVGQEEAGIPLLPPTVQAPEKPTRASVNQIIRSAARRKNMHYSFLFNTLYREFRDRTHHDVLTISKHRDVPAIAIVEELDMMEELHAIAYEMYGED